MMMSELDRQRIRVLAGILRVAIGLDRRHQSAVRSVRVLWDDVLRIEPVGEEGADLSVEVHAARGAGQPSRRSARTRSDRLAALGGVTGRLSIAATTEVSHPLRRWTPCGTWSGSHSGENHT